MILVLDIMIFCDVFKVNFYEQLVNVWFITFELNWYYNRFLFQINSCVHDLNTKHGDSGYRWSRDFVSDQFEKRISLKYFALYDKKCASLLAEICIFQYLRSFLGCLEGFWSVSAQPEKILKPSLPGPRKLFSRPTSLYIASSTSCAINWLKLYWKKKQESRFPIGSGL